MQLAAKLSALKICFLILYLRNFIFMEAEKKHGKYSRFCEGLI